VVCLGEVVVNGFWDSNHRKFDARIASHGGKLIGRAHGAVSARIEKVADVMGAKFLENLLQLRLAHLKPRSPQCRSGRVSNRVQCAFRLGKKIEERAGEHSLHSIHGAPNRADFGLAACFFHNAQQTRVDDRRGPPAMSDERGGSTARSTRRRTHRLIPLTGLDPERRE